MLKLARWSTVHRWPVLLAWIALVFVINAIAQSVGTTYSNNFTLPGSDAQRAASLLQHSFHSQAGDRDTIVYAVHSGSVRDPAIRTRMSAMFAKVEKLPHVVSVISPYADPSADKSISADGKVAFATVVFDKKANFLPKSAPERVVRTAKAAARSGPHAIEVELGGQAIEGTEQEGFGISTAVGLLAAIVVLLLTFGSLLAMGLPIVTALCGLGSGLATIALFTHLVDTPDFSSELAAMIGLGVGIDYALFILTRFREAYHTPGPTFEDVRASVVQAMDTAGRAVLFAGATVVIALLGLMLLGVEFLYGVALSASIGVLLMMLASLTLLPTLLTFAGARLARPSRRARARAARGNGEPAPTAAAGGAWLRWSAFVHRRPWTIAALATIVMLAIATPAIALRLGASDASSDPAGQTTHGAYELLARGFGQGFNGPLLIVVEHPRQIDALRTAIAATRDVAAVTPPQLNDSHEVATLSAYPSSSPQAYATTQLVSRLRDRVIPPLAARTGMTVYVGGVTAGAVDFATVLAHKLPLFVGVVVLLSALLLMVVFRSLVVPLQAAVMNLLSISAALGVIVAIFQWGWLGDLVGVQPGPVEAFIPVFLFAIVFGLSMDYEVFLISRMHERWRRTHEHSHAVADGLSLTGRVVTAAAAIMVCVFLSFTLLEGRVIKEFGLSLASAVFLDALVVRCLLLPAVLHLVGPRTWWLPARLDRLLPQLNVEGTLEPAAPAESGEQPATTPVGYPLSRSGVATEGAEA